MMRSYQRATPATPASGYSRLYTKSDGKWYFVNSDGVETTIADGTNSLDRTGVGTNSAAAAGKIGEYKETKITSGQTVSLNNATPLSIISISLTAGDWVVGGVCQITGAAGTLVQYIIASASSTQDANGDNQDLASIVYSAAGVAAVAVTDLRFTIPPTRFSLAATTTIYMTVQAGFSISTLAGYGRLSAWRVR